MTYAYLRQLSDSDKLVKQKQYIFSYSAMQGLTIEKEIMEYSHRCHSIEDRENFETFIHGLEENDILVVQNLSILSCHINEIIKIINCMLTHKVILHLVDSKTVVCRDTNLSSLFPLLNKMTEEQKKQKKQRGRPKGSRSSSKFDASQPHIIEMLKKEMNVSAIARKLNVSRSSLKDYIESRELRRLIEKSWIEISDPLGYIENVDNHPSLVCPFEQNKNRERV